MEVKVRVEGREHGPGAATEGRREVEDQRGHRAPVITGAAIISAEERFPTERAVLVEAEAAGPRMQAQEGGRGVGSGCSLGVGIQENGAFRGAFPRFKRLFLVIRPDHNRGRNVEELIGQGKRFEAGDRG